MDIQGANFIRFAVVLKATNNFNEDMILGEGGFSIVYKGLINDTLKWAVKKAKKNTNIKDFRLEVENLGQIRHVNLVELIGYSYTKNNDQIIVLEYMAGGNLYDRLHSEEPLQLKQRLHIALNAAEAINYLHKFTRHGIVHRDIKSTNILIDDKGNAKVSDFGLSRALLSDIVDSTNDTNIDLRVTQIAGTFGYMDPEWFSGDQIGIPVASTRSDVYAFGVVLFEILTGKAALIKISEETHTLVNAVQHSVKSEGYVSIVDRSMIINSKLFAIFVQLAQLAAECCNRVGALRPTMEDISRRIKDMHVAVLLCNDQYSESLQLPGDILTDFNIAFSSEFQQSLSTLELTRKTMDTMKSTSSSSF